MNIAEINLFLVRSDAIDVTGIVCGEFDESNPAAFCTELRDCLVVYYEKFCAMEFLLAAGEEELLAAGAAGAGSSSYSPPAPAPPRRRRGGASLRPQPCPERGLGQAGGRQAIRLMPIKTRVLELE